MNNLNRKVALVAVGYLYKPKFSNLVGNVKLCLIVNAQSGSIGHDKRNHLIINKSNLGFSKAVNQGIRLAIKDQPTHFLLLNPDIRFTKKDLETFVQSEGDIVSPVLKFKREGKDVFDYGGKINWFFGRPWHIEKDFHTTANPPEIDYVSGAAMLIKREVVDKIGLLDERFFMYFEDADFCVRAKKAGFKISVNPNTVFEHDIQEHKKVFNPKKSEYVLSSNWKFIQKWIPYPMRFFAQIYWVVLKIKTKFFLPQK